MGKESRGLLWPLQLVFAVMLVLGLIALFDPQVFGAQLEPDRTIAGNLLFGAGVAAILLYAPRIWIWMATPSFPAVAATVDETRAALRTPAGDEKLDVIRAEIAQLRTRLDGVAAQLAAGGDLRARIEAINTLLNTGGDVRTRLDAIIAQLATGGEVRGRIDAINAQFNAGGGVRNSLDAIETKLKG